MIRESFRDGAAQPSRVILDHLKLDWISIEWLPEPAWQLSGGWEMVAPTDDPASVAAAWGTGNERRSSMELFGEINDPAIVASEVDYDGLWHRFEVANPGYIVWLDGCYDRPSDYRWLDGDGNIVWDAKDIQNVQEPWCFDGGRAATTAPEKHRRDRSAAVRHAPRPGHSNRRLCAFVAPRGAKSLGHRH